MFHFYKLMRTRVSEHVFIKMLLNNNSSVLKECKAHMKCTTYNFKVNSFDQM